jgi:hypothetical protein
MRGGLFCVGTAANFWCEPKRAEFVDAFVGRGRDMDPKLTIQDVPSADVDQAIKDLRI